jgi:hypothetical protein
MGFLALAASEIQTDKPITQPLMQKVKDNFDYLYGLSAGGGLEVFNGSMEVDADADGVPDGWTKNLYAGGAGALTTAESANGLRCFQFVHPGGAANGGGWLQSDAIAINYWDQYYLSYFVWASTANIHNKVQVEYFTAAMVTVGGMATLYDSTNNSTDPTRCVTQFIPGTSSIRYCKINLLGGTTDKDVAANSFFDDVRIGSLISQAKLKTSTGSGVVSSGVSALNGLSGGEYGFYPQTMCYSSAGVTGQCDFTMSRIQAGDYTGLASYIYISNNSNQPASFHQRYVTASGEIFWIFIKRDKATKETIVVWAAEDHPCFGNGNDPNLVPHPFGDYDKDKHEIVCITLDKAQYIELAQHHTKQKTMALIVREMFEIDEESKPEWPTTPVTVGLPDNTDWTRKPDGFSLVPIKQIIPQPDYILCRALKAKEVKEA